jgi:hypothetical protein
MVFFGFTPADRRLALVVGMSPEPRYRLCVPSAPPWTMTLAELVAATIRSARAEPPGPIVLEAIDDEGLVLWRAWHSNRASFEARVVELVSECARPNRAGS